MLSCALHLLGPPRLEVDGTPVHIARRKALALLTYLAVTGCAHTRDALATLLWPEWDASRARADLRRDLSVVNQLLSGAGLEADRELVQLSPELDLWLDVVAFRAQLGACAGHGHAPTEACSDCVPLLEGAVALYNGVFMAGFTLPDSAGFDEWQFFQTEALKDKVAGALVRLATYYSSQGDLGRAIGHARRRLAVDPLHEPAHRHLMVLYARSNQRTAALRQYETCCRVLEAELGAGPSERTQDTYQQILQGAALLASTAVEAVLERELRPVGPCPYRGLAAFREADEPFFFGRDASIERLEACVAASSITAVVGPSGSGKSSVVYAGLLPRLRDQGGWVIADLRPGREPFQALAGALLPQLEPELGGLERLLQTRRLGEALGGGELPLRDVVSGIRGRRGDHGRLLLVVDQFEELYTLCPDPETRERFIDTLLETAADPQGAGHGPGSFTLLLTLRADFMGQALSHRPFADALQPAARMLGPMTREELRAAIKQPGELQGAAFEAGLVERLLDDVGEAPGNLPLLEFALTLLWERLDFGWLTHAAYEAIGRVVGALARHADGVVDALGEEDQALARRIFTQLVQPGEGTEDTRRVAARADAGEEAWGLVQRLADKRLVVTARDPLTGDETVEVVHEALIRSWGQLQGWMAEDRQFRTWQERLRVSVRTWESTGRDAGALLRGVPLAEAEAWLGTRGEDLGAGECAFVAAGIALREQRAAERAAQRQADLEAARELAEAHEVALRQAAIGLAAEARNLMQGPDQDLAALLALEAVEHFPYTWQAELALSEIVRDFRLVWQCNRNMATDPPYVSPDGTRLLLAWHEGPIEVWELHSGASVLSVQGYSGTDKLFQGALWSPEGDRILAWSGTGRPHVWNAATGELLIELEYGRGPAWFPDGKRVLTFEGHGAEPAQIWDARTGQALLAVPGNPMSRVSPDGRRIALSTGQIWDAETGEMLCALVGYDDYIPNNDRHLLSWSPDGRSIGTGVAGSARVWDALTGAVDLTLPTGYEGTADLSWSPGGNLLLTTGLRGERSPAILWNADTGERLRELPFHDELYWSADAWSPKGDRFALPDVQGCISVWEAATGRRLLHLAAHHGTAYAQWLPDGLGLASSGEDGLVRVWRTSTADFEKPCELEASMRTRVGAFTTPIWSPDGTRVGRNWFDGTVRIWDIATGVQVLRLEIADATGLGANWMAWAPQGERIVTGAIGGNVAIYNAATGERHLPLHEHNRIVPTVAWSPDGQRVLSVSMDGTAIIWDGLTGEELRAFAEQDYYWGAWSPDGQRIVLCDLVSFGGPVRIRDAATGEALLTLLPDDFGYGTSAIAWSPDGTRIVALSTDRVGRIWEAETGELLGTFPINSDAKAIDWSPSSSRFLHTDNAGIHVWNAVTLRQVMHFPLAEGHGCARWSPAGTAIAIAHRDGDLGVYPAWESLEALIAYAKEHCVLRELNAEERARYGLAAP